MLPLPRCTLEKLRKQSTSIQLEVPKPSNRVAILAQALGDMSVPSPPTLNRQTSRRKAERQSKGNDVNAAFAKCTLERLDMTTWQDSGIQRFQSAGHDHVARFRKSEIPECWT